MLKKFLSHPVTRLLRLNKPAGIFLLFWPCAYAILLFGKSSFDQLRLLIIFFFGSFVMRAAGCIINDIFDKELDVKVARTKTRPLAEGSISLSSALTILLVLLCIGFLTVLSLPISAIKISLFSSILVVCYPLVKRFSNFPQVFLGFTFNIGVLAATSAVCGRLSLESVILYIGCIFWTIGYDTVYGFMDIMDDKKIGIKSLAIILEGPNFKAWIMAFYTIFILCIFYSAKTISGGFLCYLLFLVWTLLMLSVNQLDLNSQKSLSAHFNGAVAIGGGVSLILYCC